MKIFITKRENRRELTEAINLFEINSAFKSFETNFHAIFKFENISDEDERQIYSLIDNIERSR